MAQTTNTKTAKTGGQDPAIFFVTYVLEFITGIIVYLAFSNGNKRLKFHAMQATVIGIIAIIISVVLSVTIILAWLGSLIALLIWLYCLYIGYKAYQGVDVDVPFVTSWLKSMPDMK